MASRFNGAAGSDSFVVTTTPPSARRGDVTGADAVLGALPATVRDFFDDATVLVAGGGGFIGGHLVRALAHLGTARVRAVDARDVAAWAQRSPGVEEVVADLSLREECHRLTRDVDLVFNLASDMGGMGYIEAHRADCMLSVLINTHLLLGARQAGVARFYFASSACVYNESLQRTADPTPLREEDAYPALPDDGYGWEKLFGERMCRHFQEDFGLSVRIARYHNVFGPFGAWAGGREKAPAALCRKIAEAIGSDRPSVEVWGDGRQTRSFMYVDDCGEGTLRLMASDYSQPLNLGSSEPVTIDELLSRVERIAGVQVGRTHLLDAPTGVRGRSSDNTRLQQVLGWTPSTPLDEGLAVTYEWVARQVHATRGTKTVVPRS